MATREFPSDSGRRKVILVLEQHDVERCEYERGAAQILFDDEMYVLSLPVRSRGARPAVLQDLMDAGLTRPGAVLVQSPYDPDVYQSVEDAALRFALDKYMYFSELCQHLGAREINVEQSDLQIRQVTTTAGLRGVQYGMAGEIKGKGEELRKFREHLRLHDRFIGGPPDLAEAEKMLRHRRLWGDPVLRSLVKTRASENRITGRSLVLNLSTETANNLKVVGRLYVPTFVAFSVDYQRFVQEQRDYVLKVSVEF